MNDLKFGEFQQQFSGLSVVKVDINLSVAAAGIDVGDRSVTESLVQDFSSFFQFVGTVDAEVATAIGRRRGGG